MIHKFRRKQVEKGIQYREDNIRRILEFTGDAFGFEDGTLYRVYDSMKVAYGEWIIKYGKDEDDDIQMREWWIFTDEDVKRYFIDVTYNVGEDL